jgi:hypothetical protein
MPDHIDSVTKILNDLVTRDEGLENKEDKLNLGDKLVKWVVTEGDKAASPARR